VKEESEKFGLKLNIQKTKIMATNSHVLAWEVPWRKEPGKLQSGGHNESDMT